MKSTYAWENGAVWYVNHGLETYTTGAVDRLLKKKKKKNKKMTKTRFSEFLYTKWTGVVGDSGIVFR